MDVDRRHVLAGLTLALGVAAAVILVDVLATVFFAITVAYVLAPVARWFRARGLRPWWASAATAVVAIVGALLVSLPVVVLLGVRVSRFVDLIRSIPSETVELSWRGFTYQASTTDLVPVAVGVVQDLALSLARATPVLAIKLTLFGVVVFALLMAGGRARTAVLSTVPADYREVVESLADRAKTVLTAIYIVQAGTAIGTFVVGVPVFVLLGYEFPFTLAALAGILQFLPIVGPSLVIGLLAAVDLATGNVVRAVLVLVVGGLLVAWLPDPIIRPQLARRTGDFPGSLYFVGFTGGLFSLGVVGIIAGPLVVALLVEAGSLLSAELEDHAARRDALARKTTVVDTLPLGWVPSPFGEGEKPDDGSPPPGEGDRRGPGSGGDDRHGAGSDGGDPGGNGADGPSPDGER